MSQAFMKESEGETALSDLPDRPLSPHRNFVTLAGLAQLDTEITGLRHRLAEETAADRTAAIATLSRDLRYWIARRASAELVAPSPSEEVRFGATVTIARGDGRRQTFRIVGEDEADPAAGLLSYVAPLARALIGKMEGDEVEFMDETIAIIHQS